LFSPPAARSFLFMDVFGISTRIVLMDACRSHATIIGGRSLPETSDETKTDEWLCANWDGKLW
jgi:hypothetical protein